MHRRHAKWRNDLLLGVMVLVIVLGIAFTEGSGYQKEKYDAKPFIGVCPPFFIRDESGAVINPVNMQNTAVPYSPRQTCGTAGCHDYEKISKGYHFQQGKDEAPGGELTKLYQWVLSPGQYGGRW